jgi:hypothetical protein
MYLFSNHTVNPDINRNQILKAIILKTFKSDLRAASQILPRTYKTTKKRGVMT